MNPTVSIFVAATLLLASSGAEAARGTAGGSTNLMLPPTPPASTAQPHTNPIGGVFTDQGVGGPARRSRIFHLRSLRSAAIAQ